jgi:hypothetical protein
VHDDEPLTRRTMMKTRHQRLKARRRLKVARKIIGPGLQTLALVSLVRRIGPRRAGRLAAALGGAYLERALRRGGKRRRA